MCACIYIERETGVCDDTRVYVQSDSEHVETKRRKKGEGEGDASVLASSAHVGNDVVNQRYEWREWRGCVDADLQHGRTAGAAEM